MIDPYGVMVIWAELLGRSVALFIWVFVPFSIGYGLPFLASGRKGLNAMWVLAALALLSLAWILNAHGGPFGFRAVVVPWIFALAFGFVLSCSIREFLLRRAVSRRVPTTLAIGGFATMPMIVAGINALTLWAHREPNAACLAAHRTVDVAGTRYRLPNVPFVLMPDETNYTADGFINQRLRNRCASAQNSEAVPLRSGFRLDLHYGGQFQFTKKICADSPSKLRWMLDACAARSQVVLAKMQETFAGTHLPLALEVSEIPRTTERPYTLLEEHRSNLRRRDKRPYRELPGTSNFSIYADGEKAHYGETRFWIRKDVAQPEAFACRNIGNNVGFVRLLCKVRYARGATLIAYEFETEPGREEDTAAQIHARVQDVLAELAMPP